MALDTLDLSREFALTRFDAIAAAIEAGDAAEVARLGGLVRTEYLPAHDGMRDTVAAILDFAARASSPEEGEAIGRRVIERLMGDGEAPQYAQDDLRERVRSIAAGWHWHGTSFTLVEDEETVTFELEPCGSGGRLEIEGRYDGDDGFLRSRRPSPSTFMLAGFPLYSNHCAEMTRAGLAAGNATFVVEGWHERGCGACVQRSYKRLDAVPSETYRRVGLNRPAVAGPSPPARRLFTGEELAEEGVHPLERVAAAVARGDAATAHAALASSRAAWGTAMHGAYRHWIAELWGETVDVLGAAALEPLLDATAPELVRHRRGGTAGDWAAFWSIHSGLRSIDEREGEVAFTVDPAALLDPGCVDAELLVSGLQRGLAARGWVDAGAFACSGAAIRHVLAAPGA